MGACLSGNVDADYVKPVVFGGEDINSMEATKDCSRIIFIGDYENGEIPLELMFGDDKYVADITDICSGYKYSIYCNYDTQQYYISGDNRYGQLGFKLLIPETKCSLEYADVEPTHFSIFNYFKCNNIKIIKVCTNALSSSTFWITNENKVYCHGRNDKYQLGINNNKHQYKPCLIKQLENVIDIKSCTDHSMALCGIQSNLIINRYLSEFINNIPSDIIDLITIFYGQYTNCKLFVSGTNRVDTHLNESDGRWITYYTNKPFHKWTEMEFFKNKEVIKIDCTADRFFCLESNGIFWNCKTFNPPKQMKYFMENEIKIIDIACGMNHIATIDSNYKVYSWRASQMLFCGEEGHDRDILYPQINHTLSDYKIIKIKCGSNYSYALSNDGKHFLADRTYGDIGMFGEMDTKNNALMHISLGYENIKMIFEQPVNFMDVFVNWKLWIFNNICNALMMGEEILGLIYYSC